MWLWYRQGDRNVISLGDEETSDRLSLRYFFRMNPVSFNYKLPIEMVFEEDKLVIHS